MIDSELMEVIYYYRLDLCAAVIAVRLAKFVARELDVTTGKNCILVRLYYGSKLSAKRFQTQTCF